MPPKKKAEQQKGDDYGEPAFPGALPKSRSAAFIAAPEGAWPPAGSVGGVLGELLDELAAEEKEESKAKEPEAGREEKAEEEETKQAVGEWGQSC